MSIYSFPQYHENSYTTPTANYPASHCDKITQQYNRILQQIAFEQAILNHNQAIINRAIINRINRSFPPASYYVPSALKQKSKPFPPASYYVPSALKQKSKPFPPASYYVPNQLTSSMSKTNKAGQFFHSSLRKDTSKIWKLTYDEKSTLSRGEKLSDKGESLLRSFL